MKGCFSNFYALQIMRDRERQGEAFVTKINNWKSLRGQNFPFLSHQRLNIVNFQLFSFIPKIK